MTLCLGPVDLVELSIQLCMNGPDKDGVQVKLVHWTGGAIFIEWTDKCVNEYLLHLFRNMYIFRRDIYIVFSKNIFC